MSTDYEWMRQRRRDKKQEQRDESDLDDRLEDGFSLLQDDDDLGDELSGPRPLSSKSEELYQNRKRTEL